MNDELSMARSGTILAPGTNCLRQNIVSPVLLMVEMVGWLGREREKGGGEVALNLEMYRYRPIPNLVSSPPWQWWWHGAARRTPATEYR